MDSNDATESINRDPAAQAGVESLNSPSNSEQVTFDSTSASTNTYRMLDTVPRGKNTDYMKLELCQMLVSRCLCYKNLRV